LLDEYLASVKPENFIFETVHGSPADLEGMVRKIIRPSWLRQDYRGMVYILFAAPSRSDFEWPPVSSVRKSREQVKSVPI
jgi:hypothetical protein